MQQADQKDHLALFNLQDVKYIYKLLAESYPDNIQYQEDFIAFVYNVLDDESEALSLINKTEQRMDIAHRYFEKVKEEIKNR